MNTSFADPSRQYEMIMKYLEFKVIMIGTDLYSKIPLLQTEVVNPDVANATAKEFGVICICLGDIEYV
jgi:hypothetical protein